MVICDAYIDGNTADANGTPVTAAILANMTEVAIPGTWTIVENSVGVSSSTSLTIGASGGSAYDRADSVGLRISGNIFLPGSTHRPLLYDCLKNFTYVQYTVGGLSAYAISISGLVTLGGPQDAGAGGTLFDIIGFSNNSGNFVVCQLNNGNAPNGGGYAFNLHTNPGGVSTQTGRCVASVGGTYHISLFYDSLNSTAELYIKDPVTLQVITGGHITASTGTGASNITTIRLGNAEIGTSTGTLRFENFLIDWIAAASPLGPQGPQTLWWLPKSAGATSGATSSSSQAVTLGGVSSGDIPAVYVKWEGSAVGDYVQVDDGTSQLVQLSAQRNAQGDPCGALFIAPAASGLRTTKSGSVTFTAKFFNAGQLVNRTFKDVVVTCWTPPINTIIEVDSNIALGTSVDATHGAAGNPPLPSSGDVLTTAEGISKLVLIGYSEFGATIDHISINGERNDSYFQCTTAAHSVLAGAVTSGAFRSPATGILSANNRWDMQAVALSARPIPGGGRHVTEAQMAEFAAA